MSGFPAQTCISSRERAGTSTNQFGFFSLIVGPRPFKLSVTHVAYFPQVVEWSVQADTSLVFLLQPRVTTLDAIVVTGEGESRARQIQMSQHSLPVEQVESLPVLLGETDVLKTLQLLPGIQSGREGFSGIYVRGGRADQNLILLDGLPLYNPNHALGLFSVFNPSAMKQVELIKGGFPARYGGRLSSVVSLTMKEGNLKHFGGEGKLGLITSRLMFEGPLVRERASFIVSRAAHLSRPDSAVVSAKGPAVCGALSGPEFQGELHHFGTRSDIP